MKLRARGDLVEAEPGPPRRLRVLGDAVVVLAVLGDRQGDPLAGRLRQDAAAKLGAHPGVGAEHGRGAGEHADELGHRAAGRLDALDQRRALVGRRQLIVDLESADFGFYCHFASRLRLCLWRISALQSLYVAFTLLLAYNLLEVSYTAFAVGTCKPAPVGFALPVYGARHLSGSLRLSLRLLARQAKEARHGRATAERRRRRSSIVKEHDVRFVRLWFTDVLGQLKSFSINAAELEDAFDGGMGFDGSSITGFNPIEESDMIAMPDPSTFALMPWRPEDENAVARMFCDIRVPGGEPLRGRSALDPAAGAEAGRGAGLRRLQHRPRARVLLLPLGQAGERACPRCSTRAATST